VEADRYRTVLEIVREWPPDRRFALIRDLLETLAPVWTEGARRRRRATLEEALGLLATQSPPPSDEEIQQWLNEHRLEKYG